jgi:hypothetical protein
VHAHRDLIEHGARGENDRRLLAEERRDHLLEVVHRRVLTLLLVAHLGVAHEPAHGRRRPGHRVAEKIDIDPHRRAHGIDPPPGIVPLRLRIGLRAYNRARDFTPFARSNRPWPTVNASMWSAPR